MFEVRPGRSVIYSMMGIHFVSVTHDTTIITNNRPLAHCRCLLPLLLLLLLLFFCAVHVFFVRLFGRRYVPPPWCRTAPTRRGCSSSHGRSSSLSQCGPWSPSRYVCTPRLRSGRSLTAKRVCMAVKLRVLIVHTYICIPGRILWGTIVNRTKHC